MSEPICWHKEINDEGICKACGAKAAIKLEGMPEFPAKGRDSMGVRPDGSSENKTAEKGCEKHHNINCTACAEAAERDRLREENRKLNEALDGLEAKWQQAASDMDSIGVGAWQPEVRQCAKELREARAAIQPQQEGEGHGTTNLQK